MAVPEQTPYKEYTANGSTASFALGFICDSKNDLIVLVDGVEPPIATWSLIGANAVFTTAPASGKKIILQRNTAMSRTTNFQGTNNSFRPETINKDIDRVWLKLQELGVAGMLLKIYVDRLHGEQKDYIDNKDQLVRNIISDLRNYVNQQDNSRNSYFENLISSQGVSLQQLDNYYNYLMERIAQIDADKGWDASFVVDGVKNQKQINSERKTTTTIRELTQGQELSLALESALAVSNNITINASDTPYSISSNKAIELSEDTVIDFNNQPINFTGSIQLKSPVVLTTTISAQIFRYATHATLASTTGIQAGDLMYLVTNVVAETQWSYKKQDCIRIKSVSGNVIELEEPFQFAYAVADAGLVITIYRPKKVVFKNPVFNLSNVSGQAMFDLVGLVDIEIHNPKGVGVAAGWDASENELRRMFRLKNCFNVEISGAEFTRLSYPILISDGTRNVTVNTVSGTDCRHVVEPTSWAKNIILNNLTGSDNYASISSHPAFDVEYIDAVVSRDRMPPNLRCVRGALRNIKFHTLAGDEIIDGSYFQSLSLPAETSYLWSDADMTFDGIKVTAPNRTRSSLGIYRARNVFVSNCEDQGFFAGILNGVSGQIYFGAGNNFSGAQTPSVGVRALRNHVSVLKNPLLSPTLINGVYEINLRKNIVDQTKDYLKCYGSLPKIDGDQIITLRIHDNCFSTFDNINTVQITLKLKTFLSHSNQGGGAFVEKWWSFYHKASITSEIVAPLMPIFETIPQDLETSTLDVKVVSVSQFGRTEAGANGDFYVDVQISLMSGRLNASFKPCFELELNLLG